MNMNDAFVGSLIFNRDGGGGGGDTPLEFTKTSILNKTETTNIVLTADYTDYPFLLFVFDVAWDNSHFEVLVPTDIITEAFGHSLMIAFPCVGDNAHVRYSKISNTQFKRYDGSNQITISDVFGVAVNKSFTTDVIYSRGNGGENEVSISHNNILDNDLIFFSGCWNADADFANNFIWNNTGIKEAITQYNGTVIRRGNSSKGIIITNTSISSAIHYMVLGIKFT